METRARYKWWASGDERAAGKEALRAILERRRGVRNAVTSEKLARELDLSTRKVRELIAELIDDGMVIGASVDGKAGGYYIIETLAELNETRAILRSRATEIFARDRALCRAWQKDGGQVLQPLLPGVGRE